MSCLSIAIGLVAVCVLYKVIDWLLRLPTVDNIQSKYVLITGCDTGFGNKLAKDLDKRAFHVIAACLTKKGAEDLDEVASYRLKTLIMDVSKSESVKEGFNAVKKIIPKDKGLWGLVNNAGIVGAYGVYEWHSRDDYQKCLDVNLLGLIDVTTTFLPLIKKSRGRIVNVASIMGRFVLPGGAYSISKFGVEAFSDGLRLMMYPFGVRVSTIEPGFFNTNMNNWEAMRPKLDAKWESQGPEIREEYGEEWFKAFRMLAGEHLKTRCSPNIQAVTGAMEHALMSIKPRIRYVIGWDAHLFFKPMSLLPSEIADYILIKLNRQPLPRKCVEQQNK
ncbi:17-beta-hydroxysteroid dehydrogenase type 6-like [Glandiceps talaboti]